MRMLWVNDTHCGSVYGLTPEGYRDADYGWCSKPLREFYLDELKRIGPVDILVLVGDIVDGMGNKDASELISTDTSVSRDIAVEMLGHIKADETWLVRGTPFHTFGTEDLEELVANDMGIPKDHRKDELRLEINGHRIMWRHAGRMSAAPQTPPAQLFREWIRDVVQGAAEDYQWAHCVVRAHTHYYFDVQTSVGRAISLPCMEWPFGKYGRRLFTQWYHMGLTFGEVSKAGVLSVPRPRFIKPYINGRKNYICRKD